MSDPPPQVPASRRDHGDAWRQLWEEAHRVMRPYGRAPSMHLVDRLLEYRDRRWLQAQLHAIVLATLDERRATESDDRAHWTIQLWNPGTMKREHVRIVLDRSTNEVLNAIPIVRRGSPHAHSR